MFGLPEALMSFIRRQVGLRTDAASASGSLHGKVGDIKAGINSILSKNVLAQNSVVKKVQKGTIVINGTSVYSQTATISAVNTEKSLLVNLGQTVSAFNTPANAPYVRLELTNTTTVTATRENDAAKITVNFMIIEFY